MALDSDALLEHLLFQIATAGENGIDVRHFSNAVESFYASVPSDEEEAEEQADDGDLLFSLKPPSDGVSRKDQANDPQHLEKLWTWLLEHPDISIGVNKEKTQEAKRSVKEALIEAAHVDDVSTIDEGPATEDSNREILDKESQNDTRTTFFEAHEKERLHANENRIWVALTDHGVDHRRIPKLEFICLSAIAAAGPRGLIQPEVTKITGQDKRSVPKRTDALVKKGLITKVLVSGVGVRTSLLTFKKFENEIESKTVFEVGSRAVGRRDLVENVKMIRYEDWFDELMGHLQNNNNLMAVEDLRKEMEIHGKRWETRTLHRCLRRLGRMGLCARFKARTMPTDAGAHDQDEEQDTHADAATVLDADVQDGVEAVSDAEADADADVDYDSDAFIDDEIADIMPAPNKRKKRGGKRVPNQKATKRTPKRGPTMKGPKKVTKKAKAGGWIRCVKLLREPTAQDKLGFTSNAISNRKKLNDGKAQDDSDFASDTDDEELEELDADEDTMNRIGHTGNSRGKRQRIPSQWRPSMHLTQFIFNLVHSCGTKGISTMDLMDRALGHHWRRPLDELLGRLTDVWQFSQPAHLRHLSVIRDTSFLGRSTHFQYRSFENHKKLVDAGKVTWEAVGTTAADTEVPPELDEWGFFCIKTTPGIARTLPEPGDFYLEGKANMTSCKSTIDNPSHRRAYDASKLARVFEAKSRVATTPRGRPAVHEAVSATMGHDGGSIVSTPGPAKSQRRSIATPATVTLPGTLLAMEVNKPAKLLFQMKPARAEAEYREWQARAKRLAESLTRVEFGLPSNVSKASISEPRQKRRKKEISTGPPGDEQTVVVPSTDPEHVKLDVVPTASTAEPIVADSTSGPAISDPQNGKADTQPVPDNSLPPDAAKRMTDIEAEILSLSKPGCYINPPGSGQVKMSTTMPTGRPSRYLIAVIKTPRLRELKWFNEESQWPAPLPRKPRINAKMPSVPKRSSFVTPFEESTADVTSEHATPTPTAQQEFEETSQDVAGTLQPAATPKGSKIKEPKPDYSIRGGRKRRSRASLVEHVVKRQAMMNPQGEPTHSPLNRLSTPPIRKGPRGGYSYKASEASKAQQQPLETPKKATRIAAPKSTLSVEQVDVTMADDALPGREDMPPLAVPGSNRETITPVPSINLSSVPNDADTQALSSNVPEANIRPSIEETLSKQEHSSSTKAPTLPRDVEPTTSVLPSALPQDVDQVPSIPPLARQMDDAFATPGPSNDPSNRAIISIEQVTENTTRAPGPRSKVGVSRSGGITRHQRDTLMLKLIHENGGIFGGDRELHLPFVTQWEKTHDSRPDRHTVDRLVRNLISDGKLSKIAFTFQIGVEKTATKHIVMEPEIDPESEAVKQLQQNMIAAYPSLYIPSNVEVAPDLQVQVHNDFHTSPGGKKHQQLTVKDYFPEDASTFVERLYPSSSRVPLSVKLGMTEARIEREGALRKRKREQEERRQGRYVRAQQEEEIDEAQVALQTDFQLSSYQHDPDKAVVDRGPRGRGRLSKLQRWGASEESAHKKALGLLGAAKRKHFAEQSALTLLEAGNSLGSRLAPRSSRNASLADLALAGGFYSTQSSDKLSTFGSTITEVFTVTSPYQRFYPASGTFSTDSLVIFTAASNAVRNGTDSQAEPVKEQLTMFLADVLWQANSNEPSSTDMFGQSTGFGDALSGFLAGANRRRLNKATAESFPPGSEHRVVASGRIPRRLGGSALQRLPGPLPTKKTTSMSRATVPRASRSGMFTMKELDESRLIIALVVVRTLTGGLEQITNWGLVHQIFHYKFDANYCRNRWAGIRARHATTVDKLQAKFQEIYIEAYEKGELPEIDFMEPEKYDWIYLVEWAEARLDPSKVQSRGNELPELIQDREVLREKFHVNVTGELYSIAKEDYWMPLVTHLRREELANQWTHSALLRHQEQQVPNDEDSLMLAKSWVRANVLTPDAEFNGPAAHDKLLQLGEEDLPRALDQLLGAKIIRIENKGRGIPGRNYDISDTVLATFKRTWDANYLRLAAAFKKTLDAAFATDGKMIISYAAPDHDFIAMTNLVSAGRAKVAAQLPAVNHTMRAPWPRLTKWGFTEGNYKTVQMNKERLYFGLELHPTEKYVHGNPIKHVDPPLDLQVEGEVGARLPLWTDINGKIIQSVWDMMVMATLHILAFRPGLTTEVVTSAYKGKLWQWEIELFLRWAEEAELVKRTGEGVYPGWTTAEWWWLAFAEEDLEGRLRGWE